MGDQVYIHIQSFASVCDLNINSCKLSSRINNSTNQIKIAFDTFDIEDDSSCRYASLIIYNIHIKVKCSSLYYSTDMTMLS